MLGLPAPSRLAIGALIRLYLVPRPPPPDGDPQSVAALQGGPVVEALTACTAALAGGSVTAAESTAQAVFVLEAIEAVGSAREEVSFDELLVRLGRACPMSSPPAEGGRDGERGEPPDPAQRLLPRCLRGVMRAASESPDDLLTLLALLREALAPPRSPSVDGTLVRPTHVETDSVFGVFLRQLLLECDGMGFETLASFLEAVRAYVRGIPSTSLQRPAAAAESERRHKQHEYEDEAPHPFWGMVSSTDVPPSSEAAAAAAGATGAAALPPPAASARQAQQYLQRRALELEGELGTRAFGEAEGEVERLLSVHPELPRGQFLRFLNSSSHREFAGALDAAHRYFDYALRRGGPNATGKTSTSRNTVQYAALNLAALHHRFGHTALALAAAQEAVRVAQQNADHQCVALALAWLYQLLAKRGDAQVEGVLRRCVGRAADLRLRHVEGTAALALAAFQAAGGGGFHAGALATLPTLLPPWLRLSLATGEEGSRPRAIRQALRASVAAETAGLAPPPPPAAAPPAGGPPQPANVGMAAALAAALQPRDAFPLTPEEAARLAGRRCAVASGAWEVLGHRELMLTEARKLLYCYDAGGAGGGAYGLDVCLGAVKLALAGLRGGGGREEELLSYAHSPLKVSPGSKRLRSPPSSQATHHHDGEGRGGSGSLSLYEAALSELTALQRRFPVPVDGVLPVAMALLLHEQAALRGELQGAYELGLLLRGVSRPAAALTAAAARGHEVGVGGGGGLEAFVEGLLQWCAGLAGTGRASECVRAAERLAAFCERKSLPLQHMRALLLLAQAHLRACPSDPCAPLPPLLRCLTLAEAFDTDTVHAAASLTLAEVHLQLGAAAKARALLKAALPTLLEHAPVREQGEAWLLLAKCFLLELSKAMTSSTNGSNKPRQQRSVLLHALALLARALPALRQSQDLRRVREVYYLEARLHDRLAALQRAERSGRAGEKDEEEDDIDHVALRQEAARHFFDVCRVLAVGVGRPSPVAIVVSGRA